MPVDSEVKLPSIIDAEMDSFTAFPCHIGAKVLQLLPLKDVVSVST